MDDTLIMEKCADIIFLALMIWREARGESRLTQEAVAMCVINRVEKPKWWGDTIINVIFKKWQFSSLTDPKDRQLTTWPSRGLKSWNLAMEIAEKAVNKLLEHPAPNSDSYYDDSIPRPYWATNKNFVTKIGKLNFHNVDNDFERV